MPSTFTVHGNAVTPAERAGGGSITSPGDLENVDGIAWTDVVGLRQGLGTTFRGKGDKFVWFHLPFPTPVMINDRRSRMRGLDIHFDVAGPARMESLHLWGSARNRWHQQDGMTATADVHVDLEGGELHGCIGISMGIRFDRAANITFRGATLTLD
jgi:hypothetical protein